MTEQTKKLCKSMPQLAKWFEDFDDKGHDWIIVSWQNVLPWRVVLKDITPCSAVDLGTIPNIFTSRTAALRQSESSSKHITYRSEIEHWGVWTWKDGNEQYYQSVLPAACFNMGSS